MPSRYPFGMRTQLHPCAAVLAAACSFASEGGAATDTDTDDETLPTLSPTSSSSTSSTSSSSSSAGTSEASSIDLTSETSSSSSSAESSSSSSSTGDVEVPPDAIAFYAFEGNADDLTGNGHDGELVGDAIGFASGRVGEALRNEGPDSYVEIPHAEALSLTTGYTIAAWVRAGAGDALTRDIIGKGQGGAYLLRIGLGSSSPISAYGGPCASAPTPPPSLAAGDWHHIAWTWDGETMRSYIDGEEIAAEPCTASMSSTDEPLYLLRNTGPGYWLDGELDELAIFDHARTAAEICEDAGC